MVKSLHSLLQCLRLNIGVPNCTDQCSCTEGKGENPIETSVMVRYIQNSGPTSGYMCVTSLGGPFPEAGHLVGSSS
jgi:hypothetical protein